MGPKPTGPSHGWRWSPCGKALRLVYYHRLLRWSLLEGMYGGFSLEAGRVGKPLVPGGPEGLLKSGSLFLGVDSPVGPPYLGIGRAADGNSSAYLFPCRP